MKTSDFQFTNPSIVNLKFVENDGFDNSISKSISLNTQIETLRTEINKTEASVRLNISLGEQSNDVPFVLEIGIIADFRWSESLEDNIVEKLLSQNAPSLLVAYARPIISTITNASHFPVYNLPFINFRED